MSKKINDSYFSKHEFYSKKGTRVFVWRFSFIFSRRLSRKDLQGGVKLVHPS